MSEKNVRELTRRERRRHSLSAKTVRTTVKSCVVLGLVALIFGLLFYSVSLVRQYIRHACDVAGSASNSAIHAADSEGLSRQVMELYRSRTEQERLLTGTPAYREPFAYLTDEKGGAYDVLIHMLSGYLGSSDVDDVYLAMYDEKSCAMVYIVDPDPDDRLFPGEWESVTEKGMRKFLDWDGEGQLYDIDYTEKYGWLCTAGLPLRNAQGETYAFLLVDVSVDNVIRGMTGYTLQITLALALATALIAWILSRHMKKNLVEPINAITEAATDYVRDKREGKACEHFSSLNIHTRDEIENLSLVMSEMERDLAEHEKDLTRITAEKERIGTELDLATRIQASMLPHVFPPFPERSEIDIYAVMDPAKEVGGDFYDFFLVDEDHLCMIMADVSGKGIPAALFMMASKIILQSCAMLGRSPAEILTKTNEALCSNNQAEMFVTVWVGVLELSTGLLRAANAGHEYPVFRAPGGSFELLKDKHGFVIGGMDGMQYQEYTLMLEPGAKLFVYTDGVPEATDAAQQLFGIERMLQALNEDASAAPEQLLRKVRGAVDAFVGGAEQFDDLTMLCLQYNGPAKQSNTKEITLEAKPENIQTVTEFVDRTLEELDCPPREQMQIDVAVDELFSNIARYAYAPGTGLATVRLDVESDPKTAVLTFIDNGKPFDPLSVPEPDISRAAQERTVGGLGIFLVKKTMDEVRYEYRDGQNVLRIKKRIEGV